MFTGHPSSSLMMFDATDFQSSLVKIRHLNRNGSSGRNGKGIREHAMRKNGFCHWHFCCIFFLCSRHQTIFMHIAWQGRCWGVSLAPGLDMTCSLWAILRPLGMNKVQRWTCPNPNPAFGCNDDKRTGKISKSNVKNQSIEHHRICVLTELLPFEQRGRVTKTLWMWLSIFSKRPLSSLLLLLSLSLLI